MIGLDLFLFDHDGRPAGRGLRWFRAVFVALLAAVPGVVFWFQARRAAVVRAWPVVPCATVSSGVDTDDGGPDREHPYKPTILFEFRYRGRSYVGSRLGVNDVGGTADAATAYARAAEHPAGSTATCYVDPARPDEAGLVTPPRAWEPWAMPVSAAVFAGVVLFYSLPQVRGVRRSEPDGRRSSPDGRRSSLFWGVGLFAGAGAATWFWWAVPVARTLAARRWPAVPCVVEAAHLQSHRQGGEAPITLYRTDVLYRYDVDGRAYHSNCYSPTESGSPASGGRAAVIADYPPGRRTVCYVDPADPTTAMLTRRFGPTVSFAVMPVLFTLLGGWMVVVALLPHLSGPTARLLRRVPYTLAIVAVGVVAWTAWGVFGRP